MFSTGRDLDSPSSEALHVFEDILRSARASQSVRRKVLQCNEMHGAVTNVGSSRVSRISMDSIRFDDS